VTTFFLKWIIGIGREFWRARLIAVVERELSPAGSWLDAGPSRFCLARSTSREYQQESIWCARVAELADALDSGSSE
jgi:hypothetical protein